MEEGKRIVIISPVRDEAEFLEGTIRSIAAQTVRPVEWVIVNDGSKDATGAIIDRAAQEHPWITAVHKPDRGERAVGPGVIETFYYGYERMKTKEYDYICKMDGDLEIPPVYFETTLSYFEKDPALGALSGKYFLETEPGKFVEERSSDEMVGGLMNFYRRKCFDDMGGYVRQVHWDGIAFHTCRLKGWRTRSVRTEPMMIKHMRLMGSSHKGIWHGRLRWGRGQWFMGTHPLYLFAIGFYRMFERPYIVGGLGIVVGYFKAMLEGMERYHAPGFRESLHAWQFEKLHLGKRLEKLPPPPPGLYP